MSLHERGPQESRSLDLKREPQFLHIGTEFDFGGIKERIITRENLPLEDARKILKGRVFGVLGYGVQGPAQAMNLRDNGLPVIIWQRKEYSKPGKPKTSWERAVDDGWKEGETLFPDPDLKVVMQKANFIQYLLSDAGQAQRWPEIRALLKQGDVLQFSHGFAPVFHKLTEVVVPEFVDLTLIAPKGPGRGVREHFEHGRGVNSSVAVAQDASGKALLLTLASGMAIGSGFLFPTSFEKEVFSDLTGERGILMGAFKGLMDASYNILRAQGLSPEEAARHTVEITTQTVSRLIGEKGADGLLRELPKELTPAFLNSFYNARLACEPAYEELYQRVASGVEAERVLKENSKPDYRDRLNDELKAIRESEFGKAATYVRQERKKKPVPTSIVNKEDAVIAGALVGIMHAQYELLRNKGHMPSEAFNETVEEATQSLYPLIDKQGVDDLYINCSTTAQRGALDWHGVFRDVLEPTLKNLYQNENSSYRAVDPNIILASEMWRAGKTVRELRPENQKIV